MFQLESLAISSENSSYSQSNKQQSNNVLKVLSYNNEHKKRRLQHSKIVKDELNVKKDKK
jgi:pantothenate synthetase